MKEKPNYEELEKRVDFTALNNRLGQLTEADNPQRKTVFTLLDKVREPIVTARRNRGVSYQVLAKELTDAGIPVSEPTLRKYLRAQGVEKKQRKKLRHQMAMATASPPHWPRMPERNRRRQADRISSISTSDRVLAHGQHEHGAGPFLSCRLREARRPSVTPATRLLVRRATKRLAVRGCRGRHRQPKHGWKV